MSSPETDLYDLADWVEETWTIPYKGVKYQVPPPSAELGLRIEALFAIGDMTAEHQRLAREALAAGKRPPERKPVPAKYQQLLDDEAERDLYRDVLGPAHQQLVDAGMSWPLLKHCAVGAMMRWHLSEEMAEAHMRSVIAPPKAPNRASRRATSRTTGAASTTKRPASGSGTKPRRNS